MFGLNKLKLINKIYLIVLSLIIFYTFIVTWNEIKYSNSQIDNIKQEMPNKITNTWQQLIQNTSMLYMGSATVIADIPLVSNAYLMENRKILEQLTDKIQHDLYKRQDYPIQIHFHEIKTSPTPKSFLKLWDKENFGEDLSHRNIISYAYNRMTSVSGIDRDKDSLIISGISPIKFGDKVVGSVEIFSNIQFITNELSKITNSNNLLYLNNKAKQNSQQNNFILAAKSFHQETNNKLNEANRETDIINIIDKNLLAAGSIEQVTKIYDNNFLVYTPIFDFDNQNIGVLVSQINIAEINNTAKKNILQILFKALIITSIIGALVYFLIQKNIKQPLANLTDRIQELGTRELDLIKTIEIPTINCSNLTNCNQKNCIAYDIGGHCWTICGSFSDNKNCPIMNTKKISCVRCHIFNRHAKSELDKITIFLNIFTNKIGKILKTMTAEIRGLTTNTSIKYNILNHSLNNINKDNYVIIENKIDNVNEKLKLINNNLEEINNQWNKMQIQNSSNMSLIKNECNSSFNAIDTTINNILSNIHNFTTTTNMFEESLNKIIQENDQINSNTKTQIIQNLTNMKTLSEYINNDIRKHTNLITKNKELFNKILTNNKDILNELQKNMEAFQNSIKTLIAIMDDINTIKLQNSLARSTIQHTEENISKINHYTIKSQETIAKIKNTINAFKIDTL